MKIIGQGENSFILEANRHEVANLIGFYYQGEKGCPELKPGLEICVSRLYQQLYHMKTHEESFKETIKTLRKIADNLELVNPVTTKEELN